MRALDRKRLRDLRRIRSQAAAIAAVVASGIAVAVLGLCNLETLSRSRADFYERTRFADVFLSVRRAPLPAAQHLAAVPGVAAVEPRVVAQVRLDMPGVAAPVAARVIGRPTARPPLLNDLFVRRGRDLEAGRDDEALVSEPFAAAHALEPGAAVRAVINGRRRTLRIVGVVLSPEFIYAIPPGGLFPDDRRFGVLWMAERPLAAAMDMDGAFNDALLRLERGASASDVLSRIDRIIAPYGGAGAYERSHQISHWFLEGELSELRTTSRILPLVFAAVAAFLLYIVMSRLIATEREQIGLLKAFGYRSRAIAAHYTGLALIITAGGIAMGVPAGIWLGWMLSGVYQRFFHFPALVFAVPFTPVAAACAAAAAVTAAGSLAAVRGAVRLPPAEAMRPPSPPRFRRTLVERLGLGRLLSPWASMVARNLERRPVRAGLTVAAIALAVGIMLLGRFVDALEFIIETELEIGQRQTATVTFVEQQPPRAALELARYPGVLAVEPFRSVAVTFRHGTRQRRGSIGGIQPSAALVRVLDATRQAIALPPEGLVLSDKLARLMDVRAGDSLSVEIREGRRGTYDVVVAGTLQDYVGTSAFMAAAALARLLREAPVVTGAHLLVDASTEPAFLARVKDTRDIASVTTTRAMRESIRSTLQRNFAISLSFLIVLAGIIAFGVVYNTTRIGLAERAWELATLRVIGFTRAEAGAILLAEAALLLILALPLGLALGYGEASLVAAAYDSEQYRIPVFFRRSSYGISVLVVVVAAVLSGAVVWRLIGRLDLIAVLKTRE